MSTVLRLVRECAMLLLVEAARRCWCWPPSDTGEQGEAGERLLVAGTERWRRNRCSLLMITLPSDSSPDSANVCFSFRVKHAQFKKIIITFGRK